MKMETRDSLGSPGQLLPSQVLVDQPHSTSEVLLHLGFQKVVRNLPSALNLITFQGVSSELHFTNLDQGLPRWHSGKEPASSSGDPGSIPGSGRCPGVGNGNLLQYSCLENSLDTGAW